MLRSRRSWSVWLLLLALAASLRAADPARALVSHSLGFDHSAEAQTIVVGQKTVTYQGQTYTDKIFRDQLGREAYFRGWNVSGSVKLVESNFRPFRSQVDAQRGFDDMRAAVGANIVRFTLSWEGVHPSVDTINTLYLDQIVNQMRAAIDNRMYVILDYHTDLFSRHLFSPDSTYTGNGAPSWITPPGLYPPESCSVCFHWSMNNLFNETIRLAYRNFFNNAPLPTQAGTRYMQDEFLWQLTQMVQYVRAHLTEAEWRYVLGVEPYNEPVYGDGYQDTAAEFDNEKLWPFYQRVRAILNEQGWQDKLVFAEPQVFWNLNIPGFATGGGYLEEPPGDGFVFTAHFYDAIRSGVPLWSRVDNGIYFANLDQVRDEARFLQLPMFLSEFGMAIGGDQIQDTVRIIKGLYEGMETSDRWRTPAPDRYVDLYTPLVAGTQWHWDQYRNLHQEYVNGNPERLATVGDAWNDEDFSAINADGSFTSDPYVLARVYPQRVQGDIFTFYYNDMATDNSGRVLSWASIRPYFNQEYLRDQQFALLIWQGRHSDAPTELFLPPHMDAANLVILTEAVIHNRDLVKNAPLTNTPNEIALTSDPAQPSSAATRLLVWDDPDPGEDDASLHFLLVANLPKVIYTTSVLTQLQAALRTRIQVQGQSPLYLLGDMAGYDRYPFEYPLNLHDVYLPAAPLAWRR